MNATQKGAEEVIDRLRYAPKSIRWGPPSGASIKALRKRLGLTQAEFAAHYGLDLRALENWEQERREPDPAAAVLLSIIEREPDTVARIISDVREHLPDQVK